MKDLTLLPLRQLPIGRPMLLDWQAAGWVLFPTVLCVAAIFWPTVESMVDVWSDSRTFAHGFLVLPIVGYLVWSSRARLAPLTPRPSIGGLLSLLISAGGWVIGMLYGVEWLQQAAVVAALPGLVWTIYGSQIVRTLSWPLGFLVFLIPAGTSLEPWLQDLTAWLVMRGLDLSGIAYSYRDYHIVVRQADWEVAPDCGGLRYLLPGLSLAYAFATLTYREPLRRIAFLIFSAAALMLANGIRAYGIIVGNDLGIAAGADHRLFSYTIYGLTMPCLLWLGLKWKLPSAAAAASRPVRGGLVEVRTAMIAAFIGVGGLLLARLSVWMLSRSF